MNRLAAEPSPYLRQHAGNPVEWYPWGDEAFDRARREDKPIFLSIGYATCHWCHVMAQESFAEAAIGERLARDFIAIKVDREERPDVDRVYMAFVQATTGSGGWPLNVWLTPSLEPFYGGTYFPPVPAWGRPSFAEVLGEVARAWREDRDEVRTSAGRAMAHLRAVTPAPDGAASSDLAVLEAGQEAWARGFDERRGGFGDGPKFPRPSELLFLLREHARTGAPEPRVMVLGTLRAMALGGMRDHVGGGFHRYSVDGGWRVPHFEKMLYDQAQLVIAFLEAWQVSGDPFFAQVAEDTLRYIERDLLGPGGGCYSAEDADSVPPGDSSPGAHATEGAFYIFSRDEVVEALGPDSVAWELRFGVQPGGNAPIDPQGEFGAKNLFYTAKTIAAIVEQTGMTAPDVGAALARGRQRLFEARSKRPRPQLDDKVLTAWNGLALAAFARAARVLAPEGVLDEGVAGSGRRHLATAERIAIFVRTRLWDGVTGRLRRRVAGGAAGIDGFAEDYACMAWGLIELFQANGDPAWLAWAIELHEALDRLFGAPDHRGWYATTGEDASVLLRQIEEYDGAEPSATSVAVMNLLALARLTGRADFQQTAERVLAARRAQLAAQPRVAPHLLAALSTTLQPALEIVVTGSERADLLHHTVTSRFLPSAVSVPVSASHAPALSAVAAWVAPYAARASEVAAFVCRDFACATPVSTPEALAILLDETTHPGPVEDVGAIQ
ncbi:MAG: thioredoxin domain-containing protein [Acidobacteria bacterium]|nr:thioredoxin domain-containing protein [Acidobacteriota bacterium]